MNAAFSTRKGEVLKELQETGYYTMAPNELWRMPIDLLSKNIWGFVMSMPEDSQISVSDLASNLGVSRPSVYKSIDTLAMRNMIEMVSTNKRTVYIALQLPSVWNKDNLNKAQLKVVKNNYKTSQKAVVKDFDKIVSKEFLQTQVFDNNNDYLTKADFEDFKQSLSKSFTTTIEESIKKLMQDVVNTNIAGVHADVVKNIDNVNAQNSNIVEDTLSKSFTNVCKEFLQTPVLYKEDPKEVNIDLDIIEEHKSTRDFFKNPVPMKDSALCPLFVKDRDSGGPSRLQNWNKEFRKRVENLALKTPLPSGGKNAKSDAYEFVERCCLFQSVQWYLHLTEGAEQPKNIAPPLFFPWEVDTDTFTILHEVACQWLKKPAIFYRKTEWTVEEYEESIAKGLREALYENFRESYRSPKAYKALLKKREEERLYEIRREEARQIESEFYEKKIQEAKAKNKEEEPAHATVTPKEEKDQNLATQNDEQAEREARKQSMWEEIMRYKASNPDVR